jgi:flagellar basal-body rod protein FlgC
MSLLNILALAGSAIAAQSQRLNTVASNLANADTVAGPDGTPYKARQVIFQATASADGRRDRRRPAARQERPA